MSGKLRSWALVRPLCLHGAQASWKTWKVLENQKSTFQYLKVLENQDLSWRKNLCPGKKYFSEIMCSIQFCQKIFNFSINSSYWYVFCFLILCQISGWNPVVLGRGLSKTLVRVGLVKIIVSKKMFFSKIHETLEIHHLSCLHT